MVLHLKPGEQGFYHFQSLAASFAVSPGDTTAPQCLLVRPETMEPLINSPGRSPRSSCCSS